MENLVPHEEAPQQEGGTARLEAFSDGVFAIAVTLLVLDLKVPSGLSPITPLTLAAALVSKWPNYLTLVISFATILIMWVYHHNRLPLLSDRNGGSILESSADPLHLWYSLDCLGHYAPKAAHRAEEPSLALLSIEWWYFVQCCLVLTVRVYRFCSQFCSHW